MPTRSPTQSQKALLYLRQRILNGSISGGTRLYEVALAEELQISRTPVRAALSQLAEEALLERGKGSGFVVRSFALNDVVDTIDLRGILEGTAARYAAERGVGAEAIATAQSLLGKIDTLLLAASIDLQAYAQLNTGFHMLLSDMAQSPTLHRELQRIATLPFASPSAFLEDHSCTETLKRTLTVAQAQHRAIVDAIVNREGSRAEALAREHVQAAKRNAKLLLSQEPSRHEGAPSLAFMVK